jgi:hypothetical protein
MIYTIVLCTGMKVGIRARHARVSVFAMPACMGVYDLALGYVFGIAHRELRTCVVSLFSHTHVRTALRGIP